MYNLVNSQFSLSIPFVNCFFNYLYIFYNQIYKSFKCLSGISVFSSLVFTHLSIMDFKSSKAVENDYFN